jgi:hypothetical protein
MPCARLNTTLYVYGHPGIPLRTNRSSEPVAVRIEYRVYFKRITKEEGSKVFKISEKTIQPNQEIVVNKRHSFKPITTRSYYPGLHGVAIIINGKEFERINFELV